MPGVRVSPLGPTLSEKPSEMAVFLHLANDFGCIYELRRYYMGVGPVPEYVLSLSEEQQRHINAFTEFMNAEYPQLTNKISSFSMPMRLGGKKMYEGYITVSAAKQSRNFLHHPGYKYSKYKQALEFICAHDYTAFMKAAEDLKNERIRQVYETGALRNPVH